MLFCATVVAQYLCPVPQIFLFVCALEVDNYANELLWMIYNKVSYERYVPLKIFCLFVSLHIELIVESSTLGDFIFKFQVIWVILKVLTFSWLNLDFLRREHIDI